MSSSTIAEKTHLPDDREDLRQVFRFLVEQATPANDVPRYLLVGPGRDEQVAVPAEVHRLLLQVVESLQAGKAVTVAPLSMTLTTQQAADLLNVGRPTVVKLIEDGQIPFERLSHRRQLRLTDVIGLPRPATQRTAGGHRRHLGAAGPGGRHRRGVAAASRGES